MFPKVNKMRLLILFVLLICPLLTFAQFFVGGTKEEVLAVLKKNNVKFEESAVTDSTSRISVHEENDFQMIWALNNKGVVQRQTLIPYKENGVNEYVKLFNRDYVVVSDTEWKTYSAGKIFLIKLEYLLKEPFFSITISKEFEDNFKFGHQIDSLMYELTEKEIRIVEGGEG